MLFPNYDCGLNSAIRVGLMVRGVGNLGCSWGVAGQWNTKNDSEKEMVIPVYGTVKLIVEGMESWAVLGTLLVYGIQNYSEQIK